MSENKLDEARLARIHEAFASVPYAKFLGLELGEIKPGEATLHLEVRAELKQNQGGGAATVRALGRSHGRSAETGRYGGHDLHKARQ